MFYSRSTSRVRSCPFTLVVLNQQFWLPCLTMTQLLPSLLICLDLHYSLQERRFWSCCSVSSKLCCDLEPAMQTKLDCWPKWGMSLLYLVQQQHLESYYLHWYTERLRQHHSSSSWCNSGQNFTFNTHLKKVTVLLTSSICIIRATTYFLGLAPFHSKDGLSCSNPQQTWLHKLLHGSLGSLILTSFV